MAQISTRLKNEKITSLDILMSRLAVFSPEDKELLKDWIQFERDTAREHGLVDGANAVRDQFNAILKPEFITL